MRQIIGDLAEISFLGSVEELRICILLSFVTRNRTVWLRNWVSFRPAVERVGGTKAILLGRRYNNH